MGGSDSQFDDRILLDPGYYAENGYPHEAWAWLRQNDPVHYVDNWGGPAYWAVTRRAEIVEVSKQPEIFESNPRVNMQPGGHDPSKLLHNLLTMDPPEHQEYRTLIAKKFTPGAINKIVGNVDEITHAIVKRAATDGTAREIEFVENIAARIPIWVIAEMLGVSADHWEDMFVWTNQAVGASDPEYQQGRTEEETRMAAIGQMFEFFTRLSEERRANPRDDLISDLVHAEVGGKKLEIFELLSYYVTLLTAGNETTRNAITGGIMALMDYPDQFEKLKQSPDQVEHFVEEVLRYVSPVIHMCRTPNRDVELGGKQIKAGQHLVLFYPSANRDETVFDDPNRFDFTRRSNPHLAFGVGEHFCLGNHVARLELRVVFRELVRSLKYVELIDRPERLHHSIVGGIKRLNVRYELDYGEAA